LISSGRISQREANAHRFDTSAALCNRKLTDHSSTKLTDHRAAKANALTKTQYPVGRSQKKINHQKQKGAVHSPFLLFCMRLK
jgi:hypothetical protein